MITPHFQGGAAAAAIRPPRHITRLLTLLALFASLATLAPATTASASEPSSWCSNGVGDETQLLSGDFGLPLWLGFQATDVASGDVNFALCYGTGAHDQPKTAGGYLDVKLVRSDDNVGVTSGADSNSGLQANASVAAQPTYSVTPGGASGGQAATFSIPIAVCSGVCYPTPGGGLATTGLILGTLTQKSAPGGVSAAYTVTQLCLKVNGIEITDCGQNLGDAGVTTTGTSPVNIGTGGATPGPCVVAVCIPSIDYVGTSGRQLATIYIPDGGPGIPVYGVRVCAYQRTATTPCPA